MDHISKAIPAEQSKSATSSTKSQDATSQRTVLPAHWVSALFKKLQARYGHKWTSSVEGIEEIAVTEWGDVLSGLTGDDIKRGFDAWRGDWPPSATEFREACKPVKDWRLQGLSMKEPVKALPEPKEAKAKRRAGALSALDGLKKKMGINQS